MKIVGQIAINRSRKTGHQSMKHFQVAEIEFKLKSLYSIPNAIFVFYIRKFEFMGSRLVGLRSAICILTYAKQALVSQK